MTLQAKGGDASYMLLRDLNLWLAWFIRDLFSIIDRGAAFELVCRSVVSVAFFSLTLRCGLYLHAP
jgi:hypothetical protein